MFNKVRTNDANLNRVQDNIAAYLTSIKNTTIVHNIKSPVTTNIITLPSNVQQLTLSVINVNNASTTAPVIINNTDGSQLYSIVTDKIIILIYIDRWIELINN